MPGRPRDWLRRTAIAAILLGTVVYGETPSTELLQVEADYSQKWTTERGEVQILRRCRLVYGETEITARQGVIWSEPETGKRGNRTEKYTVYVDGDVKRIQPGQSRNETSLLFEWTGQAQFDIRRSLDDEPAAEDPLFVRASERRFPSRKKSKTSRVNYEVPGPQFPDRASESGNPAGIRRVRIFRRSALPYNFFSETIESDPPEQIWVFTGGINLVIDGSPEVGTVDMLADRMVIWTNTVDKFSEDSFQSDDLPFQVYLEGNIVMRQGESELRAERAYYDAREDRAIMLDAHLKLRSPGMPFALRVRADRVRQLSKKSFHAQNAWVTTSRLGKPGYRVQASDVLYEERPEGWWWQEPEYAVNPDTGLPEVVETPWITTMNSKLLVEDTPLGYWPYASSPASDPNVPIRRFSAGHDSIFGTQVFSTWNPTKLFGIETPPGMKLDLMADYYGDRGPGLGISGNYEGDNYLLGEGRQKGMFLGYGVYDQGTDNLGLDRRNLSLEDNARGRLQWQHIQSIGDEFTLRAESGWLSDRNYLEQYYENEFDEGKDNENLLSIQQQRDEWAWSIQGKVQSNEFDTTTEWLPKADVYLLGASFLDGRLNWSSHSSIGYARLDPAETPFDPNDLSLPLPYHADAEGLVAMSRHELSLPLHIGEMNLVPYVAGEAAYWGEDLSGGDLDRFWGSAGVRGSLMFWRAFPEVQSEILGLNGLAHKMIFDFDYSYSDSTTFLGEVPQYNEIDDLAQIRFRQRLAQNTFGGILPDPFDPRRYGLRSGTGSSIASPYHELVDDLHALRLGWRHRLQTKTGPLDRPRIKDWMTLDLETTFFPQAERDNFGEDFGLFGARYAWHLSERTSLMANAYFDTFDDAQQLWNVGVLSQRGERGSLYVGLREVRGAGLDSQILTASYSYQMSPKWVSTFGTAFDLAEGENRGQSMTLTRVGADFLFHFGATYDQSKDNFGVAFSIEPRFLGTQKTTQLGNLIPQNNY